jgi:hypothetical protein
VTGWILGLDQVTIAAVHAWFVFFLVLLESFFSHSLEEVAEFHDAHADNGKARFNQHLRRTRIERISGLAVDVSTL